MKRAVIDVSRGRQLNNEEFREYLARQLAEQGIETSDKGICQPYTIWYSADGKSLLIEQGEH